MSDEPKEDNEANELKPEYGRTPPRVKFFKSFEEANEYDYKRRAETDGVDHWKNVTYLILARFEEELKKPMDLTLRIKLNEDIH